MVAGPSPNDRPAGAAAGAHDEPVGSRRFGGGQRDLTSPGEGRASLPGSGREVATVRRDLLADLTGAKRAVAAGGESGRPVVGLDSVVRRLTEQARQLDVDLLVVAAEPDPFERRRLLAAQADRVALLRRACGEVRRGVLLAGSTTTGPLLTSMVADLNDEIIALGLQAQAYQDLSGR